ncbi:lectin-like domain-containing protein, partial [Staphylococcus xylosus]|uniref:lectin-like domain-containing protein n=1 Tax=Staphylococcus xylosus TaxID=1288 RepID=UPI001F2D5437
MSKKQKALQSSLGEEKVRFKLYKSGKQWIKAGLKEFELLRIMGIPFFSKTLVKSKTEVNEEKENILTKHAAKTSAMVGGALTVNLLNDHYALADSEAPVTSEMSSFSETVANQNSTKLTSTNESEKLTSSSDKSEIANTNTVESQSDVKKSEVITSSDAILEKNDSNRMLADKATSEIKAENSTSTDKATSETKAENSTSTDKATSETKAENSTSTEKTTSEVKAENNTSIEEATSKAKTENSDNVRKNTSINEKATDLNTSEKALNNSNIQFSTSISNSITNSQNLSKPVKLRTVSRMATTTFAATAATIQSDNVVVTKDNFSDNMKLSGFATFNQSTGVVTLTPDQNSLKGAVSLNTKINSNKSFRFEGKVNLGNKYEGKTVNGQTGGDGIGFAFSPGALGEIGKEGAAVGIGGLKNAFGFKLDTYHNTSKPNASASALADPSKVAGGGAFGAFVTTNSNGVATTYISTNPVEDAVKLNIQPEDNSFQNFIIDYNGDTKVMTVTYAGQTWTRNISDWIKNSGTTNFSLSMTASTGGASNLQQVQFGTFTYTESAVAQAKYVDVTTGKEILPPQKLTGDVDATVTLNDQSSTIINKGYAFVSTDSSNAPTYNSTSKSIKLTNQGQTVIYYYKDIKAPTIQVTNQTKEVGRAITPIVITTSDNSGDTITNQVTGLPSGLSYNNVTNSIVGTPTQVGNSNVSVVSTDSTGNSATSQFTINVVDTTAPNVTQIANQTKEVFRPIDNITVIATDNSFTGVTNTVVGLPSGVTFDPATNIISGIPQKIGTSTVTVTSVDKQGNKTTTIFTLNITNNIESDSISLSNSASLSNSTIASNSSSTSFSNSLSTSTSGSTSLNDSLSTSTSGSESLSDSLSTSTSGSESLSDSLSTSTSGSTSLSDSLSSSTSSSTSLSESLSTSTSSSTSLSESLSTSTSSSTSLSDSLSTSTSGSESLSDSLSASISGSESLSDSLSTSMSGSESLSDSLSASMSGSESLSDSLSTSTSGSTSLSESLSTSTSGSISLSDSLSTSTSDSESLSDSL